MTRTPARWSICLPVGPDGVHMGKHLFPQGLPHLPHILDLTVCTDYQVHAEGQPPLGPPPSTMPGVSGGLKTGQQPCHEGWASP